MNDDLDQALTRAEAAEAELRELREQMSLANQGAQVLVDLMDAERKKREASDHHFECVTRKFHETLKSLAEEKELRVIAECKASHMQTVFDENYKLRAEVERLRARVAVLERIERICRDYTTCEAQVRGELYRALCIALDAAKESP